MAIERIIEYKIDENIHDIETDKTFLSYDNVDKFTIDISQIDADFESASAKAFFICYKYSDKKKYTEIKCNLDAENKKISFKIPENIRGHVGLVKSNVYLEFDNGDRLDLVGLTFKMQKSLIDENVNEVADYYYETFVEQTKELVEKLKEYENSVKQASDGAIQSIDLKKEEISHMGDGIDELVSQKMSEIQSVNTNLENYLEEKKAGLTDIENDFKSFSDIKKSNIDTLTNEILTYKSGLDFIVETKQSLIESEMGNFSNNVSTAYNQLIGYKEGKEQDIDALKTSFNDYLETKKQSIVTDLSSIESCKNEQISKIKTVSDNSIRQITDYTTQEKANMDSVVNEVRQYGTVKKSEIDSNVKDISEYVEVSKTNIDEQKQQITSIIPELQTSIDDMQAHIDSLISDASEIPDYKKVLQEITTIKGYLMGDPSKDVYGVEVDMINKTVTRISGSIGKSGGKDFDNIRAYQRRRYNLTDDGKVLAYFGEDGFVENGFTDREFVKDGVTYPIGTRVQVMVEQPKFYYKVEPLVLEPIPNGIGFHMRKGRYYICDTKKEGFKVHPAFEVGEDIREYIYLSAYEASRNADNTLMSIVDAIPSTKYNINSFRSMSNSIGDNWGICNITTFSLSQLLFLIEYATFNSQSALGFGYTNRTIPSGNNILAVISKAGRTKSLGNTSGEITADDGYSSISYRGEENIYGNVWCAVDGMLLNGNNKNEIYISKNRQNYGSIDTNLYFKLNFIATKTNGYISAFGYDSKFDYLFIPTEVVGNSIVPVGDSCWQNASHYKLLTPQVGGRMVNSSENGLFTIGLDVEIGTGWESIGTRLVYI